MIKKIASKSNKVIAKNMRKLETSSVCNVTKIITLMIKEFAKESFRIKELQIAW